MCNEEIRNIILLEKSKRNNYLNNIEKVLNKEREQKIFIGRQLYRNAQKSKEFCIYLNFNTIEKYKEFCLYVYEHHLFFKYGGMVYNLK